MTLAIDVENLAKTYTHGFRALDGVNLKVEPGKVFALLGPNGAGKTTLMRILTTQLKPTEGSARIFGFDVDHDDAAVRRLVGYVPQEMSVWTDISGYENLLIYAKLYGLPSSKRKEIVEDALRKMGLLSVKNSLLKVYSGGMIRRLEIACALLVKPKILLVDEPTIGLDPSARKVVWSELTAFKREYGVTVFFNTHYMDEADLYSDGIAIINNGKIVQVSTAEELKRSVGKDVLSLAIDEDKLSEPCLQKIRCMHLVDDIAITESELKITTKDGEIILPDVIETLRLAHVPIHKVSMARPTLDDVFLKYAGLRLDSNGRIGEARQVRAMIRRG
ncbi:MAG: ATP-binding cassette domain-containing protein [Candidatus Bathyarchaeia archaeon]|jgi:ABC-2 type transport system ATP-binding protein